MNETAAVEPVEQEQTFAGQKLRSRKRKAKSSGKAKPPTKQDLENVTQAHEALADVSEVLDPEIPSVITVTMPDGSEREVNIFKCKARQIGYVMKFLATAFQAMGVDTFNDAADMTAGLNNPGTLLTLLSGIMDHAITTAAMLTDLDVKDFLELELDDALAIVVAVWSVNQAFFLARVLPVIQGMIGRGELAAGSETKTPSDMEVNISTK